MKILFLAPRLPWPMDTGGKIRTANILRQIAKRAEIHLLCFSFSPEEEQLAQTLEKQENIQITLVPGETFNTVDKAINILFNSIPYSIVKYHTSEMSETIRTTLKLGQFNAVHVDHLHMASYHSAFKTHPCVLDEHNVESQIMERCAQVEENFLKKKLFALQAERMKTFESRMIKKFTACLAVSDDDVKILKRWAGEKTLVHLIPNGFDGNYFNPTASSATNVLEKEGPILLFTGSMDWLPNEDAVVYFAREIFPKILEKIPGTKFYIVGKDPSPRVKQLTQNQPNIIVTGRVEDVRPFVAQSDVFVVPLRIGGGTRLKILEAMAMGKAVVSTSLGAEGIEATHGRDLVIADQPTSFAQEVLNLIPDPQRREIMGKAARATACQKYEWGIVGEKLGNIYNQIVGKKS
ncbi:MAG: glycosyltransferase family 4 protein [Candidatus Omnitrophica bacterium]|nr:glycosyltransferase family 4 protein [Candidatus Omnitrophota bacterium]